MHYQIIIDDPLSFKIIYTNEEKKSTNAESEFLSNDFKWDLSEETIIKLFDRINSIDGVVSRQFQRKGEFEWDINLNNFPKISNRFTSLIPYVCQSKKLSEVLYPFQKDGKKWLLKHNNRILADDMGLGKSIQSISAIEDLLFKEKLKSILIVCPNTLVTNWESEIDKWSSLLTYYSMSSVKANDQSYIKNKINNNNILITTYSVLEKIAKYTKTTHHVFDLIIADEAHKLRNDTSKNNNNFRSINRIRTWLLTGTPLERDEEDIKNILACLEPNSASSLEHRSSNIISKSKFSEVSLRRLKKDILTELPSLHKVIEELEMGEEQKNHYKSLLSDMKKVSHSERIGFLSKLSFAAIVSDEGQSCKFDRAIEICLMAKELERKVIIFSNYNTALKQFRKILKNNGIESSVLTGEIDKQDRNRHLSKFKQDENLLCLLCNARVAGEGLTLTEASIVIFLNEWWNPSSNRQAEDRVNRIGQQENVLVYALRSKNTIDDSLGKIIESKIDLENEFLEKLIRNMI